MKTEKYPGPAFLSAKTRSTTHEPRNVLAIIKESACLGEDVVQVNDARGSLNKEKARRALERRDLKVR